jgi:hypothetical protein
MKPSLLTTNVVLDPGWSILHRAMSLYEFGQVEKDQTSAPCLVARDDAAAWVISRRIKMGAFREIIFPRRSPSLFMGQGPCPCIPTTLGGSARFLFFAKLDTDLTSNLQPNPWRACGSAL